MRGTRSRCQIRKQTRGNQQAQIVRSYRLRWWSGALGHCFPRRRSGVLINSLMMFPLRLKSNPSLLTSCLHLFSITASFLVVNYGGRVSNIPSGITNGMDVSLLLSMPIRHWPQRREKGSFVKRGLHGILYSFVMGRLVFIIQQLYFSFDDFITCSHLVL
jgi:hypothetical protein